MQTSIYVYGENASNIRDGDRFVAKVKSVEGRKVVVLEPAKCGSVRGDGAL